MSSDIQPKEHVIEQIDRLMEMIKAVEPATTLDDITARAQQLDELRAKVTELYATINTHTQG